MLCTANSQRNRREVPYARGACSVDGRHAVAPLPDRASGPSVSRSTNVPVSCLVCGPVEAVIYSIIYFIFRNSRRHRTRRAAPRPRSDRAVARVRRDGEMETDEAAACAARARDRPRDPRRAHPRPDRARAPQPRPHRVCGSGRPSRLRLSAGLIRHRHEPLAAPPLDQTLTW